MFDNEYNSQPQNWGKPIPLGSALYPTQTSFDDSLRLVAQVHKFELEQLSALRMENSVLRRSLHAQGNPPLLIPGTVQEEDSVSTKGEGLCVEAPRAHSEKLEALTQQESLAPAPSHDDAPKVPDRLATGGCKRVSTSIFDRWSFASSHGTSALRFEMHQCWDDGDDASGRGSVRKVKLHRAAPLTDQDDASGSKTGRPGSQLTRFISYPSSPGRLFWDLAGAILILYDLLAIPLGAFDPPWTTFLLGMDWFTLVFWTLNVPLSLQVGFVHKGETVMDLRKICTNYLRTWFVIDLVVVLPDWIITCVASGNANSARGMKVLRTLRLVRMVRLLRLLKLRRILSSLGDLVESEFAAILANIFTMMLLLLVISHYIGCLWFLIGTSQEGDNTWIIYYGFQEVQWSHKYASAFHWAITQFTPASMHVQPQNLLERVFAIMVVVFALVGFSYVVGSITGSLAQLRSMHEETSKQFWFLKRYLKQNKVGLALSGRIQRHLEYAWNSKRQTLNLRNSKLFSLLSDQLQSELQYELSLPFLRVHTLFSELSLMPGTTMRRVACNAMCRKSLARSDHLFDPDEVATGMYILASGAMLYTLRLLDPAHLEEDSKVFISEPVLWTPNWIHLGTLAASVESEVLVLNPERFSSIIRLSAPALAMASRYASKYLEELNCAPDIVLSDIGFLSEKKSLFSTFA